jgi:hypothetical protein
VQGIWFDAREQERLKDVKGSESIDNGPPRSGGSEAKGAIDCPVCHTG